MNDDTPAYIQAGYDAVTKIINQHPGTQERNTIIWQAIGAFRDKQPVHDDHPMRGGSIWCGEHRRWECSKNAKEIRGGNRCHGIAIKGLDRCRMHAGESLDVAKAKGEAITAWSALSGKPSINPGEAVLGMLQVSWLRVHVYGGLLKEQVAEAQENRGGGETQFDPGDDSQGAGPVGPGSGLVGHTFGAVKDIGIYASGEAIRALAQLEATERDRCVRFAKVAHDMGIAEREIQVAEQQGALLANAVRQILDRLSLTAEQRELVPTVVPQVLRALVEGAA